MSTKSFFQRLAPAFGLLAFGVSFSACATETLDLVETETSCTIPFDPTSLTPLPTGLPTYTHAGAQGPETLFQHGVASGDPTDSDVIIWTRVSPASEQPVTIPVFFEVALDEAFAQRVAAAEVTTDASVDYTVKVDIKELQWGRDYFYRFHALGRTSPVGKTRLAPGAEGARCARFAVVSCSSYAHGHFFAYGHIAERKDVDAVLHLGDYIYEYGSGSYGSEREHEPPHEIITLDDYRTRYGQYRRDPNLQAIHQAHPMYTIWDDHETANDAYADGAQNHDDGEGDWAARKAAAHQAYFEWMPIRDTGNGHIYRAVQYGELADLIFLDTRIAGRDEQNGFDDSTGRQLLGVEQENWLRQELLQGTARWEIIAQQVMVAPLLLGGGPINADQWDGYTAARERLFGMIEEKDENVVVLTGDIHTSWAFDLTRDPLNPDYDPDTDNVAVEFVVPGVSSPGLPGMSSETIMQALYDENPHLRFANLAQRGYMILNVNRDRVQGDWYLLDGVEKPTQGNQEWAAGWIARYGHARLIEASAPVPGE